MYPNDFPTEPNKSPSGLLLGDNNGNSSRPAFDRTLKPMIEHSDSFIDGVLRSVTVPQDTMLKFLTLADRNTSNNIETCGILAGTLVIIFGNLYFIIVKHINKLIYRHVIKCQ